MAGVRFPAEIGIFLNATMIGLALEAIQLLIQWVSFLGYKAAKFYHLHPLSILGKYCAIFAVPHTYL
jgi:hypothetical protein